MFISSWGVESLCFEERKSGCLEVSLKKRKMKTLEFIFSPRLLFVTARDTFELCCWITQVLPLLSSNEVSMHVSGQQAGVVSHFPYCFSWNPPAGQARGISPECVIYNLLRDDGFTVWLWKWSLHPSYHLLGSCTLEKAHVLKLILSSYWALLWVLGLEIIYLIIVLLNEQAANSLNIG